MRKPLLSDDVLDELDKERLARTPIAFGYQDPDLDIEDEEWDEPYAGYEEGQTIRIPVQASTVKSRRIESVKKEAFGAKLNRILFWIVLLLIVFLLAVFYV